MIRSAVAAPFIPISSIFSSHRGAQGVIYGDMIHEKGEEEVVIDIGAKMIDDFNEFDRLYIYHGNDWSNSLNLYGGMDKFPYASNIKNISFFKGEVISLCHDIPDYHYLLSKKIRLSRKANCSILEDFLRIDFDNLLSIQKKAKIVKHPYLTSKITVGDSHDISMYRPGWSVNTIPFKTLFGALKKGLLNFVTEPYVGTSIEAEEIELYFGNIDVRHHLCRQSDQRVVLEELVTEYVKQAIELRKTLTRVKKITICELLPIEDESRIIPKTGMYNNRGFCGSWSDRNAAREQFGKLCEKLCTSNGLYFKKWTNYLLNDKGQLDFSHMEYKRSVHLSRMSYPHWTGKRWNEVFLKKVAKEKTNSNLERFM